MCNSYVMKTTMLLTAMAFALAGGCSPEPDTTKVSTTVGSEAATMEQKTPAVPADTSSGAQDPSQTMAPGATMPVDGEEVGVLETNKGTIVVKFFPAKAPKTVENFKALAKKKFYDGTKFHRVIPGFMIQGGDPNSKNQDRSDDGMGGAEKNIDAEFNDTHHARGILSMARSQSPDSASSQFFITVDEAPHLDNNYTAFGQVVQGMDVVDKIVSLARDERDNPLPNDEAVVKSARIEKWPLKKK